MYRKYRCAMCKQEIAPDHAKQVGWYLVCSICIQEVHTFIESYGGTT